MLSSAKGGTERGPGVEVLFSARKVTKSLAISVGKRGLSNPIVQLSILDAAQK